MITFAQDEEEITFSGGVFVSGNNVSIAATFVGKYNLDENVKNLDATMRTSAIKLTGNEKDNSIIGGRKNDTLYSGAGDMIRSGVAKEMIHSTAATEKTRYSTLQATTF